MWTLLMLALCSSLQEGMRPSHCQSLCSENEKFVNNVNPCNTCENSEVCLFDTDGGPGCDCLPEFYRNKEGKCVPKEECEGGPPSVENGALRRSRPANQIQCRKDEVFLECSCERTCCNGGRTEGCSASCKKGCFCKKGLVRHEDGRCIRLKDCKKEKGENSPGSGFPPVQCSIPKCDDGCSLDYSTKPCPSCSCRDFPSIQCDMPKCDDGCSIDYSTKPCPSCSCPDFPAIQCDIPKCDEDCNIDYSTKPCPSCSCQDSPPVLCSIPNCDAGCNIDYSSKPCPSCSCPALPSPTKCRPDEQYYECIPLCHGTCSAYLTKSYLFCKMACRSGCFCRKGLYKTEDGRCVPASQCTVQNTPEKTCGAKEEYKECGSACPPTCADRGKKSKKCTKQCVSGCFCKKGFVKNGQGVCVRPQECQKGNPPVQCSPPKCAPGCSIDYSSKPCPSCSCTGNPPVQCSPPKCAGGCSIDYSSKPCPSCSCTGNPPVQCSPPKCARGCSIDYSSKPCPSCSCTDTCGANAEYRECGSACPPTCADRGKKNKICTMQCVSGCFCKKGFVKNNRGVCVKPQECEQNTCGENEEYRGCGSACPTTCANLGKNVMCTMQCVPGCYCAKGLVRNDQGKCVRPEECPQNSVATTGNPGDMCTKDEEYQECGSACPATCENIGKNLPCTLQCVPGCFCKKGLVRSDQGDCVEPQECPENSVATTGNPGDICTEDEEYQECGSACPSTCENIGKNVPCTLQCVPGCFCKKGLVRSDQGDCVEPQECPERNCGEDEMYLSCGSACAPTCSTLGRTDFACIALCVPGCFCNDGLVRNDQGECVEPEECPQDVTPIPAVPKDSCREDEVYLTCGSACPPTCSTLRRTDVACISLCVQGCFCRDGLVRNDQGECVEPEECPQSPESCPENEEYSDCASPCNTCSRRGKCEQPCSPGCDCKKGYYRDFQGKCIPKKQCPRIDPPRPRNQCGRRQQFYECIPRCSRTCEAYTRKPKVYCQPLCHSGCFCKEGLYETKDGKCVPPSQCPAVPPAKKCPKNEEYSDCVIPCNDCKTRGNCNFLVCNKGCDCREGYYRDFNGRCILSRQCPQILPTPPVSTCKADEQYYECIPSCDRTCKAYRRKEKIFCNQICISGCFCKDGQYLADDGKTCVPPEQCDKTPSSPTKKCPKNEEYSDCVVPCNDCHTRGKCNFLVCNKGCDCRKGYYRDFNGRCIPARQCPLIDPTPAPADCSPDQQYYECIPRCSRTCKAYTKSVEIFCNQLCVEGCFCKEGLYEAEDGSCVPPEQCSAPTTSSGGYSDNSIVTFLDSNKSEEELYDLIVALLEQVPPSGGTHSYVDIILQFDIDFPNEELFKNTAWFNVFAQEAEQCPENEEYSDCVNPCNDCQTRGNCNFLVCNKGCDCKKGYYRDFDGGDGRCILGLQCPMIGSTPPPNQCGVDEQFYDCIPGCQQTCFALTSEVKIACKMPCRSGCYCREGLYKKDDGTCVQPEECYDDDDTRVTEALPGVTPTKTPSCGTNEEYYGCIPTCKNTCENYQAVKPLCPRICIAGCSCKKGFVKRSDGKCVKPEKCNKSAPTIKPTMTPTKTPSCGTNEEYYGCIPTCKNTCENYQAVKPLCPRICIAGCSCKKGFVKRSDGKCVKPEKCNKSAPTIKPTKPNQQCGPEEQYYSCIPTCKNTCDNYQAKHPICPRICRRGCFCKKGLVKRRDGKCVKPEKCQSSAPQPTASLPTSNPTCQLEKEVGPCKASLTRYFYNYRTRQCEKFKYGGCRGNKNNFKTIDECQVICGGVTPTKTPNCGKNEEYYRCIPTCKNTCENYQAVKPLCPRICIAGCSCKKGFVKRSDGKCVKPEKCNKSAPTIKPTSSSPIQCSIPLCRVGCNIDYSTKPCPSCSCSSSTPSPPKCDKDEEYYDCVPNCHNTCDTYNKKGPCPLFCISGCFCKKGMIKNKDGKCVKPSKCPSSNPPSSAPAPASNPDCQQPKEVGPCRAIMPRFFFNQESRQCEQFNYGGCRGNKNNFKTKEDCESKCGSASPTPPPTPTCGADGQYYQCIPVCRNTCATYNKTNIACPDICESGCFCKEGMVKNEDGTCVSPSQCNVLKPTDGSEECGEDEEYYDDCAPKCTGTCEAYNNPGIYNCPLCKPGCWCSQGLVKRSDGQCVSPDQCDAPNSTEPPNQCGENEEYYEDCAPSCGGTCETYKKLPILNCRLCRPDCWCSKGLVKRKDGKCVPKDQCGAPTDVTPSPAVPADSCGEDEEYQECGSACPPTCATLGRTDFACLAVCVQGCFCKEGLVRNDQGDCVEPEDCPQTDVQETCSKDEEYKECGSSCPPTCSTLGKRQICTRECVPGCFCREGLVRNDQGECVEPEDCPQDENPQKCGEDEEYTDCGSACPPTCSNIGKDQVCTDQCVPGCFCAEGLVRNEKGECVEPDECPQRNSEECGEDEKYYDCAPSCGGTCDTYNKTAVILCLPCGPGCWCNEGLVKNNEGKCIPPEQCDVPKVSGPHKLCGLNEIYYDECAPSCRGTCETHDQNIECPECVPGCWCKKGYLKNQFGKCVLERKCNMKQKISQCPKDQQYYDCIPSCKRTCMTYNSTSAYCPKECIMGCFCKEGLVMNKNGECVPPEKCPITCPFNQKYYECMPDCQNRCNPPDACAAVCKSGCFCREGLVMREDGKCVRKNLCKGKNPGKPRCKPDQEYYECFQRCRNSCATRNGVCPAVCESGCFCKKGLLLDSEGNCVEPEECDDISNSAEDGSDENPDSDENSEPDNEPGDEGKCSGVNEEIVSCAKPKTCNTCLIRGNCKLKRCEKGCDCKSGYYRDDSGVCIPQDQCPGATSPSECTGENEEMVSCVKPKWCNTCGIRGNCKLKQCEAGCDCKQGYYRDDSGVCIPEDQCPGDTSSPSTLRCSMPKCDDDCNIDYSTKPCPSCSCPDSSAVQCSMPKCDDDCSIDYSTKPCPSCSCAGSPTIQCSIPKCDNDGCSIDYSTKPCPSCSCTSSPTIQCSMPKCDDEGCSIDYSTKPCPSCSCIGSPTIQCSIPKCDDDGCSVDYSTTPCPSCSCTGSPMIQCSIPKCDEDGCSIDYSTKPCPRCSCTGDSNANSANTSGADNENDSPDGSSYSEESFSSTSETESSESGSMSQSADARKKYSRSRSGSRNRSSGNSSGNEIDSKDASESRFSESGSMSQSADARKKYSMSRSGSRNRSSGNSSGNEIDSKDASESRFSESGSMNQSADARKKYYRSRSGSRSRSSVSSSDNEVNSEKNSSDESEEGTSSMSSDVIDWSSDTSSDSENSSLRFSSEMWSSSISDGNSEENEVDSTDESAVDEDMSSSDSESGYSTMSSDSENEDQNNSLDESSVSEDTTSSDRGSGYSRSSSGSTDWSSANSEKSPSKFQSGSRTRYSKMSSDFDNDEEEQEYEEYYKEDLYEENDATYKGNGNESEEYSFSWTEYN